MKVLILSAEVWQDGTNGGNVLSNMFTDTDFEFAQVYCNPGEPQNRLCTHYYQMTDSMVLRNALRHRPIGKSFDTTGIAQNQPIGAEKPNTSFYSFFRRHRLGVFYAARSAAWNLSNWKNEKLCTFILDFEPDIIFAPCYGDVFMLRLTRFAAELTGRNVISYISDDSYTLRQFSLSPYYWISRFMVRQQLRKTFPYYSLVYTMTQAQKEQCERDFGANMKILLKSVDGASLRRKEKVNEPIRIVYAGGIYLNRYKTLAALAKAIEEINVRYGRACFSLDIYTANEQTRQIKAALNHSGTTIHKPVSQTELRQIYSQSDIALHVESFDLKNRLKVRMSFSTKITDCLGSGCAVMAICDEKQGGLQYLKENDAAICVSDPRKLPTVLENLVRDPQIILEYAEKARKCCIKNHDASVIHKMIIDDSTKYEAGSN